MLGHVLYQPAQVSQCIHAADVCSVQLSNPNTKPLIAQQPHSKFHMAISVTNKQLIPGIDYVIAWETKADCVHLLHLLLTPPHRQGAGRTPPQYLLVACPTSWIPCP